MVKFFQNFFGQDEYYEEENDEQFAAQAAGEQPNQSAAAVNAGTASNASRPSATRRPNVLAMDGSRDTASKIALYEPRIYSDAKAIVTQILAGEAVIVNFGSVEDATARRIVDFMMGASFAVDGDVQRIGETIFLVTPHNFEISGTISQSLGGQFS
jgi:cell division inhibitor SepF